MSFDYKAKRFVRGAHLPPVERHHAWKEIFSRDLRAELVDRKRDGIADPLDLYRARYAETAGAEPLSRLQDLDFGIYLVDDLLVKTDRASMAHSLEARVPFCDPVVSELAFALPSRLKVRGFAKKRLLRQAVAPLLPPSIVGGRKQGFSIPLAAWLRGELEPFAPAGSAPAGDGPGPPGRPRRPPRGPESPDLGADDTHPVDRDVRRRPGRYVRC